jgi:hypothetical protein
VTNEWKTREIVSGDPNGDEIGEYDEELESPIQILTRRIVNDATHVAIATALADQPRGMLYVNDEISSMKLSVEGAREFYQSAWSNVPYKRDRQTGPEKCAGHALPALGVGRM